MNNKKYIGILIIIIALIALIGAVYFMFFYNASPRSIIKEPREEAPEAQKQPQGQLPQITSQKAVINIKERPQAGKISEEDLKRMAMSFAERLGSYSNQSNYGNIKDLKIFMSSKMKAWADNYIKDEMAKKKDYSIYYGMTAKSVSAKVKQFNDDAGKAKIAVSVQRRMATGTMNNAINYQQDINIFFIKERGAWKVDSAEWQEVL